MDNLTKKSDFATTGNMKSRFSTKTIAKIGILAAVATVLMLLEIPVFFVPGFYKLDFSEVPVLLGAFSMGPVAGILIEAVKVTLNLVIEGTLTAGVGDIANFLIGCSFIVPAAIIYKREKTQKNAVKGLIVGVFVKTIFAAVMNLYVLLPVYSMAFGLPLDSIIQMGTALNSSITSLTTFVLFATVPFNLLKSFLSSLITFLIYKKLSGFLHR